MTETAPDQGYYDREKAGDERALYSDMIRSRDFGEWTRYGERMVYGISELCTMEHYWKGQLDNPERSPRARVDIHRLIGRTAFEIDARQEEHAALSKKQAEEDLAWDEYIASEAEA